MITLKESEKENTCSAYNNGYCEMKHKGCDGCADEIIREDID